MYNKSDFSFIEERDKMRLEVIRDPLDDHRQDQTVEVRFGPSFLSALEAFIRYHRLVDRYRGIRLTYSPEEAYRMVGDGDAAKFLRGHVANAMSLSDGLTRLVHPDGDTSVVLLKAA